MKKCYTIGSISDISDKYDVCQFTENSRVWMTQRRSAQHINQLREKGVKCKVIVHQDFVYIASRYAMFSQSVKQSLLTWLKSYNGCDIIGIVMHTDYPIKKECINADFPTQAIRDSYTHHMWNVDKIIDGYIDNNLVETSLLTLAQDIVNWGITTRVYLENTTATGPNDNVATIQYLLDFFHKYPNLGSVYGIAYDTCHQFAVDGTWLDVTTLSGINKTLCPVLVHLNTIPSEVIPGSHKDRHSYTTIGECSRNTIDYYKAYAKALDKEQIPWVREVKTETMERELELL